MPGGAPALQILKWHSALTVIQRAQDAIFARVAGRASQRLSAGDFSRQFAPSGTPLFPFLPSGGPGEGRRLCCGWLRQSFFEGGHDFILREAPLGDKLAEAFASAFGVRCVPASLFGPAAASGAKAARGRAALRKLTRKCCRLQKLRLFGQELLGLDRFGLGSGFFVVAIGDEDGHVDRERGR